MRIPISWLREYVDIDVSATELADLLTAAGLEVTAIESIGVPGADLVWDRKLVLWAKILKVEQHPDADRLVMATVDYGADAPKTVITGAPNLFEYIGVDDLAARQLFSPLVLEGATYLNPYKDGKPTVLKGKELRGIYNDAMLCSAVELGLGEDADGIILIEKRDLGKSYAPGTPLQDVLGDVVIEIDIIPNIARCASIVGVAREVAAITGQEFRPPSYEVQAGGPPIGKRAEIRTENRELNPRFVAFLIEGVEQRPSPYWMQQRLRLAGQRPIHVVVDVSNYVMLEMGQPNHTFDWDFLTRRAESYGDGTVQIETRLARSGEKIVTLDGTENTLRADNIVVTDPSGILSIGGVMGGRDSEIQDETTNVLLEAAAWDFINIRKSSRELGLQTEASFRFSRGVHPSQALLGAQRAAELLRRYAGGSIAEDFIDYYPAPPETRTISLDPRYVCRMSGLEMTADEIGRLLTRLDFKVVSSVNELKVSVPDHRLDVEGKHDLVEEVCRMYGYDRIPSTVLSDVLPTQRGNRALEIEMEIEDRLVDAGLYQSITYRLTTEQVEAQLDPTEPDEAEQAADSGNATPYVRLTNPATSERVVMRRSLLSSVLEVATANSRFQDRIALFETGRIYEPVTDSVLPNEPSRLVVVLSGPRRPEAWADEAPATMDFYDLKGILEGIGASLGVELSFATGEATGYRPGRTAAVSSANGKILGYAGELHPVVVKRLDFRVDAEQPVLAAELDLDALIDLVPARRVVDSLPTHPAVREDIALVVDRSLAAASVAESIVKAGGNLLTDIELFDVYTGEHIDSEKKSLAYHLTFQAPNKTLKDKEVAKVRRKIVGTLERSIGATLRE